MGSYPQKGSAPHHIPSGWDRYTCREGQRIFYHQIFPTSNQTFVKIQTFLPNTLFIHSGRLSIHYRPKYRSMNSNGDFNYRRFFRVGFFIFAYSQNTSIQGQRILIKTIFSTKLMGCINVPIKNLVMVGYHGFGFRVPMECDFRKNLKKKNLI